PTPPPADRSSDGRASSRAYSSRTSSGCGVAAITARVRRGRCSAPGSRTRRTASSGRTWRGGSRRQCRSPTSCRSTRCTASRRARPRMPTRSRRSSTLAGSRRWRVSWRIPHAGGSIASTRGWCASSPSRPPSRPPGTRSLQPVRAAAPTTTSSRTSFTSTPRTAVCWHLSPPWQRAPRILSEQLAPLSEPLACLLRPGAEAPPGLVAAASARALLDLAPLAAPQAAWPQWLAPHQVPAAERLVAIMRRYGGALLADAVGLGKSYVALAVALALGEPFALVVPAVLAPQWRALLAAHDAEAAIETHESLSRSPSTTLHRPARSCLFIVDEAHRFRNPATNRYRALARLIVGARVLLVTATPVHNRIADLFNLFHLFLRDHDLAALGIASLRRAARGALDAARQRRRPPHRRALPRPGAGGVRAGTARADIPGPLARRDRAGGPAARRPARRRDRGDPATRAAGRRGSLVPARPLIPPGVEPAGVSRQCATLRSVPRSCAGRGRRGSRPHAAGVPALVPARRRRGAAAGVVPAAPGAGARGRARAGPRRRVSPPRTRRRRTGPQARSPRAPARPA